MHRCVLVGLVILVMTGSLFATLADPRCWAVEGHEDGRTASTRCQKQLVWLGVYFSLVQPGQLPEHRGASLRQVGSKGKGSPKGPRARLGHPVSQGQISWRQ